MKVEDTEYKDNLPFSSKYTAQDKTGKTWRFESKKFSGLYLPMKEKGDGVVVHENFADYTDLDTGEKGVGIDKPVSDEVVQLFMDQLEGGPISSGFLQDESYYTIQRDGGEQQFRNKLLLSLIPAQSPGLLLMISVTEPRLLPTEKEKASAQDIVSTAKKMVVQLVAVQEVMKNLSDMMSVEEKEEVNYTLEGRSKKPLALPTADQEKKLLLMPDLHGLSLRKSLRLLQNFDLEIRIKGTGRVISQDPPAGTVFEKSTRCILILAREVKEGQQ